MFFTVTKTYFCYVKCQHLGAIPQSDFMLRLLELSVSNGVYIYAYGRATFRCTTDYTFKIGGYYMYRQVQHYPHSVAHDPHSYYHPEQHITVLYNGSRLRSL
jgi:hypothetical protein